MTSIVKKIGNYPNLIYRLCLLLKTKKFTFTDLLDYLEYSEMCAEHPDNQTPLAKGGVGQIYDLKVCEDGKCSEVLQLCVSFNKNANFRWFAQPTIKKIVNIFEGEMFPEETVVLQGNVESKFLISDFGSVHQISESYLELIADIIANLIYDNGQCPHLTKTFGIYKCGEKLEFLMEKIPGLTLEKELLKAQPKQLYNYFVQAIMGAFSLYKHGGILHNDCHPGNFLVDRSRFKESGLRAYSGQDFKNVNYLHYHDLPEEIFGTSELIIDISSGLVKILDYGNVIIDLSQSDNRYLNFPDKFSYIGERAPDRVNFIEKNLKRYRNPRKFKNFLPCDVYGNIFFDYLTKKSTSGPFFHLAHRILVTLKLNSSPHFKQVKSKFRQILDRAQISYGVLEKRHPVSRAGMGPFETLIGPMIQVLGQPINNMIYIGATKYNPDYLKDAIKINWHGHYKDTIFKALDYLYRDLECKQDCRELDLNERRFNPDFTHSDSLTLVPREMLHEGKYEIEIYRDFPELQKQDYYYGEETRASPELTWPHNVRGKRVRSIYGYRVAPKNCRITIHRNVDLMEACNRTTQNCLAVGGAYFLVNENINNKLGNIEPGSKLGDPLGISLFGDRVFNNPFPPAYQDQLLYVAVDGKSQKVFTAQQMMEMAGTITLSFNYWLEDDRLFTREIIVPDLKKLIGVYQTIYQTGPILYNRGELFSAKNYDREFVINQDDLDHSQQKVELGTRYSVYQTAPSFTMFRRAAPSIPSLYAMNVSNVFVNRNILLFYEDGSYQYLMVAGRGYGAEGIDIAQLSRLIYNTVHLSKNLVYACNLDGGFSSNFLIKENGDYTYGFADPERRALSFACLFE